MILVCQGCATDSGGLRSSLNWGAALIFPSHSGSASFCFESRLNFWTLCDRCLSSYYITAATAFSFFFFFFIGVKTFFLCSAAHLASGDIKIAPWFSLFFFLFFWSERVSSRAKRQMARSGFAYRSSDTSEVFSLAIFFLMPPGVSCNIIGTTGTEPSDLGADAI